MILSTESIAAKMDSDYERHAKTSNESIYVMLANAHARYIGTIDADVLTFHHKPHLNNVEQNIGEQKSNHNYAHQVTHEGGNMHV